MPIHVHYDSSMHIATANAIRLRGRLFYLAPCHAFFDRVHKSNTPTPRPSDDFDIDSDSDNETDELEASITSIGSQSPDSWSDNGDSSDSEDIIFLVSIGPSLLAARKSPQCSAS